MLPAFGSPAWAEDVFANAPVRRVAGRTKWTQRAAPMFDGQRVDTEGLEVLAAYALEYFKMQGVVTRWKLQPFYWRGRRVPDALVELAGDHLRVVVQIKSHRYLTTEVQAEFEDEARQARAHGLEYAVWTDRKPLSRGMADTLLRVRGARNTQFDQEAYTKLLNYVRQQQEATALNIVQAGHPPYLIPVAVRKGDLFINITERLHEQTIVSCRPKIDGRLLFLGSGVDAQAWWNSLPHR